MDLIREWTLKVKLRMTPRLLSSADRDLKNVLISRRHPPTFGRHASGATTMTSVLLLLRKDKFLQLDRETFV